MIQLLLRPHHTINQPNFLLFCATVRAYIYWIYIGFNISFLYSKRLTVSLDSCLFRYFLPLFLSLIIGLFGFDKIGPDALPRLQLRYWRGIADVLKEKGSQVYIARVPSTGNIEERARQLDRYLQQHLPDRDVNLVAHSMGGLDSRYLITHLRNSSYTVRSLTTISVSLLLIFKSFFSFRCQRNSSFHRHRIVVPHSWTGSVTRLVLEG